MTLRCASCDRDDLPDDAFPMNQKAKSRRFRDHKCRQCKAAYYRANRTRMAAQARAANIKSRYGLSVEQYDAMIAAGCVLCGRTKTKPRSVVVDHCHATGRVRGALCARCNGALGAVKDDAELLFRMANYLRSPNDRH